jgi:hypothetical protein
MYAWAPGVCTIADSGFPGSLHAAAPGPEIAIVAVFETHPPALMVTGIQQPSGAFAGTVATT